MDIKKYTLEIPLDISEKVDIVKKSFKLKTIVGTFVLGIEILHWIITVQKEGFEVKAEKKDGNLITIQKLPFLRR